MNCPIPRKSQILTAAGSVIPCQDEATVLTMAPFSDKATGKPAGLRPVYTCLYHAVEIATWKLSERLRAVDKQRRIITAG